MIQSPQHLHYARAKKNLDDTCEIPFAYRGTGVNFEATMRYFHEQGETEVHSCETWIKRNRMMFVLVAGKHAS